MKRSTTLQELVERAHDAACRKGWWTPYNVAGQDSLSIPPDSIAAKCMLVVTEIAEAVECVRDGQIETFEGEDRKPEGLPIELADVVIRVADLCGAMGIDLDEAVRIKLTYNATRKHRHGGRAL